MISSKCIEYLQTRVEGQLLDRKRASINPKDVAQHISALASAEDGKLVIGIEDNGEVSEFNHSEAKKKEVYTEAPFEHLYRAPKYAYEIIEARKHNGIVDEILIFDIEPSYGAIITLKDGSVYLGINDKSRKLTHNQTTDLEYDRGSQRFEEELVGYSSIEGANEELVDEFKRLLDTNVDNEKLLKVGGFMREGRLTIAGLLLFSNNINVYLPGTKTRFIRHEGTEEESGTGLNIVKDIIFDRALPVAIREARAFISTQLCEYTFLGKEGRFVTLPGYPEFAWFEGMINSIVHRRHDNRDDHIGIKIFNDRLEISSPGVLPASATLENIKEEGHSRNPKLAATLTQYKRVRESNEGMGRIFDEMRQYFLDDPVYSEPNNSSVQLALKNSIIARKKRETGRVSNIITPELFESLNEQQELIARHLYNQSGLTASKIANIIQRSVPATRKRLKELGEMNIVSTYGSSKNDLKRTYYLFGSE